MRACVVKHRSPSQYNFVVSIDWNFVTLRLEGNIKEQDTLLLKRTDEARRYAAHVFSYTHTHTYCSLAKSTHECVCVCVCVCGGGGGGGGRGTLVFLDSPSGDKAGYEVMCVCDSLHVAW